MTYFPNQDRRVPLGRPPRYPWDEWADGREHVLREGQDFSSMAESFVMLCRRTARLRSMHVTASTTSVPEGSQPLQVEINGETQSLEPGGTYVLVKFAKR